MTEWIYGRNAVYEVCTAGRRRLFQLLIAKDVKESGRLPEIIKWCSESGIPIERVERRVLDNLHDHHQGVVLETSTYPYCELPEILELASQKKEDPFILILDTLQDPQNLGTLLRTAEIVGVHGVIMPLHQTAKITSAVTNASSGACEHLLITQANLAQAIKRFKKEGIWVIGLENIPNAGLPEQIRLDVPLALVVGSEGQGIRPLVRDSCDVLLRLPMRGKIESLNAAVAGSIALYMAWGVRGYKGSRANN